jgi:type II secretory pathway component GspD/PulD (secretin)
MKITITFMLAMSCVVSAHAATYAGGMFDPDVKVTLTAKNQDVVDILQNVSQQSGKNIAISSKVQGTVTVFVKDVTADEAFSIVLKSADLAVAEDGDVFYVMTKDEFKARSGREFKPLTEMKVLSMEHVDAAAVSKVLGDFTSGEGKVVSDQNTNSLVMYEQPSRMPELERIAKRLDVASSRIGIDIEKMPPNKQDYYSHVRDRIAAAVPRWYFKSNNTVVKVHFVLNQFGELIGAPEVLSFSLQQYWKDLAIETVNNAAPFAPFPDDMQDDTATFEIEIAL